MFALRSLFNLLRELFQFVFGFGGVFEGACEAEGLGKLDSSHVFSQVTEGFFGLSAGGGDDGADFFAAEVVAAQKFPDRGRKGAGPDRHREDDLFVVRDIVTQRSESDAVAREGGLAADHEFHRTAFGRLAVRDETLDIGVQQGFQSLSDVSAAAGEGIIHPAKSYSA